MSQAGQDELRSADANRRAGVFIARKEVLLKILLGKTTHLETKRPIHYGLI